MSKKHSSWKDNEFYCHLLTRNLASFSGWTDPPVDVVSLFFPLLMLLNCPPYMCRTLNPLDQLYKKLILHIVLKTSIVYCSLNSANPYTFKHLNNGGSIQNDNTDSKCDFLQEELMPRSQSVALQPQL